MLSASMEDYLEIIYNLTQIHGIARIRDIAAGKQVSMASASEAMKRLSDRGLVNHDKYNYITLTDHGNQKAKEVSDVHALLSNFFTHILHISPEIAEKDACAIEHHISKESINAIKTLLHQQNC